MTISPSSPQPSPRPASGENGFSLVEAMVALSILLIGVLGLAQTFVLGLNIIATSTQQIIAREKAREAIESVHTARDNKTVNWAAIGNAASTLSCPNAGTTPTSGGRFLEAPPNLLMAGPDGLVNTSDDVGPEVAPGADGRMGTTDDVPLVGFTRTLRICAVTSNQNLREVTVIIRYPGSAAIGGRSQTYTLATYISSYS
jgi:prepilin-type N-terminal cleavage/methylation domain-containing protein